MRCFSIFCFGAVFMCTSACDQGPKRDYSVTQRSELVQATEPPPPPPAPPVQVAPVVRPKICTEAPAAVGRLIPMQRLERLSALGGATLPERVGGGSAGWVWVNIWAAWCGPCRAEMPRIREWEVRLRAEGVPVLLAYVSLDDDKRQTQRFLSEQPMNGLRSTYRLEEGAARASWLSQFRIGEAPELPLQLLFNRGALACVINGEVEESDYAQLKAFMSSR